MDQETCGWNEKRLEMDVFDKLPMNNPFLSGHEGMANGVCDVVIETPKQLSEAWSLPKEPARDHLVSKESFEASLLPTLLLALDGVVAAIQSLETASSMFRARALSKLLTKITK